MKKIMILLIVVIVVGGCYFGWKNIVQMTSKPVEEYDPNVAGFLENDGSTTQLLDKINKLLDEGKISVERAKELTEDVYKKSQEVDKTLDSVGLTQEKRDEILKGLEESNQKILDSIKNIK